MNFYKRPASEVGVKVGYHRGKETHGRIFLIDNDSDAVGGQCSKCHVIVWTSGSRNCILRTPKPNAVPDSGKEYSEFVADNRRNFLHSFPFCPECNAAGSFDVFVNNIASTRYEDGTEKIVGERAEYYDASDDDAWVWWADC